MIMASFRLLHSFSSSSSVGLFGTTTKPRKNNVQNLLQKVNTKIYSENENRGDKSTMKKMEVGVNKLVYALKGLVVPEQQNLVSISKNNGFSAIKEFQLELEDPEEKLGMKIVEGMQFDCSFLHSCFVEEIPFDHENCKVLLVDKITNAKDLASVLKDAIKGGYPILIMTLDAQREAVDAFVASSWPLGAPKIAVLMTLGSLGSRDNDLDDIAVLTGATVIKEEVGLTLENVGSEVLGFAAKVVVADGRATIVGDGSRKESLNREAEKIRELVMTMTKALEIDRWDRWDKSIKEIYQAAQQMREIERLDQRLVRLYGGVAVIEMAFKKGIVAGGGCTLDNDEHKEAAEFFKTILSYPIKQIAKNAGVDENVVVEKVLSCDDPYYGYNVATKTSKELKVAKSRLTEAVKDFASYMIYLEDVRVERLIDLIDELIYEHIDG